MNTEEGQPILVFGIQGRLVVDLVRDGGDKNYISGKGTIAEGKENIALWSN